MIDVQTLINNIKTITSKPLCTWGEFLTFLSTELQYFKQKGGITVNPPEVVLPDGVTTTTLISQSEMAQFVTNTLNVWLGSIESSPSPPVVEGYDLNALAFPKVFNCNIGSSSYSSPNWCRLLTECNVRYSEYYYSNVLKAFQLVEDGQPQTFDYHYFTNMTYGEKDYNPRVMIASIGKGGMCQPDLFPIFNLNSYSVYSLQGNPLHPGSTTMKGRYAYLTARFTNTSLEDDCSNLISILNGTEPVGITLRQVPISTGNGLSNTELCTYIGIHPYETNPDSPSTTQYIGATKILIGREWFWADNMWATDQNEYYPIMEISQDSPWFSGSASYTDYFKLCLPYPSKEIVKAEPILIL